MVGIVFIQYIKEYLLNIFDDKVFHLNLLDGWPRKKIVICIGKYLRRFFVCFDYFFEGCFKFWIIWDLFFGKLSYITKNSRKVWDKYDCQIKKYIK